MNLERFKKGNSYLVPCEFEKPEELFTYNAFFFAIAPKIPGNYDFTRNRGLVHLPAHKIYMRDENRNLITGNELTREGSGFLEMTFYSYPRNEEKEDVGLMRIRDETTNRDLYYAVNLELVCGQFRKGPKEFKRIDWFDFDMVHAVLTK